MKSLEMVRAEKLNLPITRVKMASIFEPSFFKMAEFSDYYIPFQGESVCACVYVCVCAVGGEWGFCMG